MNNLKCPNCSSKDINTEYLHDLGIDEYNCNSCGYEAHPMSFQNNL